MNRFRAIPLFGRLALAFALLVPAAITHAQGLETTSDLRDACQQAPNNTITLLNNTKIFRGAPPVLPEQVNCGCTIIISSEIKLEFEDVGMTFAGDLSIVSVQRGELRLKNTAMNARSAEIYFPGSGSLFSTDYANLDATAGDLTIDFGDEGNLQTKGRLIPGDFYSLRAAGAVRVSGGAKLNINMEQNHVIAPGGFELSMNGPDGLLKCDTVRILASAGPISISAASAKATVDLYQCWLVARDQIHIGVTGSQSKISMKRTNLVRDVAGAPNSSILVEASGLEGSIEASQVGLSGTDTAVTLRAGDRGSLKVENSAAFPSGAVQFLSGFEGTTEIKGCNLISEVLVRAATGLNGSCNFIDNQVSAPIVEACE